ncbi:LytTR family DNA-binding domain-containing protein [Larkinella soli]|uniref:LytTR family DNA-binding domain-containing protein n=1 Tax=Larkinella soli TaxID=1770527 RepID=UPI000FFBC904|nr:LytTR family DNA-binding domain-containing protein [Larkinella soli]
MNQPIDLQPPGFVRSGGFLKPISPAGLIWVEADENYTRFHWCRAAPELTAITLARWQERLPNFIRINKKALVNPLHISRVYGRSGKEMVLVLTDGTRLAASRRRIRLVRNLLLEQLPNGSVGC